MNAPVVKEHYRSIWISDIHLGTPGCKASYLLEFLRHTKSDNLYLVGDIIDGWSLKQGWYWPQEHNDVVQKLLRKARQGTNVVFIPGNHDEFARPYVDHEFGAIKVVHETIHETADGRQFLVLHGDEFDVVVRYAKWLAYLGDWAYGLCLKLNDVLNGIRERLGYPYWSLSAYLKLKVKNAVQFIADFEAALADVARQRGVDGVICGHIHHAEIRDIDGVTYCNDGDWVESCSALVEHQDGRLEILYWMEKRALKNTGKEVTSCASSSSRTPGTRKSTALFERFRPSGKS
ncbi:UDP-2,3-diacylglucosamine diphosphatase [Sneathiella chinensis]|uniref:UDP-2,3-diacylglucosamine hydrolase n=1 Tax=Sneathiella chinensis TaxID=349750 RepID=A0ABQ5U2I2_9PROT|nr:UDP-2,3-diacylglucosamine diphosphatase [Sneathiella chinensis]GLQ05953.1 UDP-2,3-diacylglucosamine hydrolase [Sneathiella chinensis]